MLIRKWMIENMYKQKAVRRNRENKIVVGIQ